MAELSLRIRQLLADAQAFLRDLDKDLIEIHKQDRELDEDMDALFPKEEP